MGHGIWQGSVTIGSKCFISNEHAAPKWINFHSGLCPSARVSIDISGRFGCFAPFAAVNNLAKCIRRNFVGLTNCGLEEKKKTKNVGADSSDENSINTNQTVHPKLNAVQNAVDLKVKEVRCKEGRHLETQLVILWALVLQGQKTLKVSVSRCL